MMAVVLSISLILFDEVKIISGIGNSVFSFYAVDTGIEKTLYFDRKIVEPQDTRGLCNICSSCNDPSIDPVHYCNSCTVTPLEVDGCGSTCNNCRIDYESVFAGSNYSISATVPSLDLDFNFDVKGIYKEVTRKIQLK